MPGIYRTNTGDAEYDRRANFRNYFGFGVMCVAGGVLAAAVLRDAAGFGFAALLVPSGVFFAIRAWRQYR